jgi:hypothetical protein
MPLSRGDTDERIAAGRVHRGHGHSGQHTAVVSVIVPLTAASCACAATGTPINSPTTKRYKKQSSA